ncbi:MAG: UDP-N-acetylmuramoyl-L-alanine--D-glutamate ligase [Idiomarina sp.]|nr:UDP-N-acetylmuramoyl-L-alanine--D-glutamate ligase [Idiomarina sp.]
MKLKRSLQHYDTVLVVGFGLTGMSCVRFLLSQGVNPIVLDSRETPPAVLLSPELVAECECYFGEFLVEHLLAADLVIVSPGLDTRVGPLRMAADSGIPLISDIELFAWYVDAPVVAITGSNGKSTVTELTSHLLTHAGKRVGTGGNIGTPALDLLLNGNDYDCFVLELSSFQLELTYELLLDGACVLNVSSDHLDRYDDERGYQRAKQRIYRHARHCVWNADDPLTQPRQSVGQEQETTFSAKKNAQGFGLRKGTTGFAITWQRRALVHTRDISLQGTHNWQNVMAALALCKTLGVAFEDVIPGLSQFKTLPHRCELVADVDGVRWIDDSKATNPGAAAAAIEGFRASVDGQLILIAGGDSKGADLTLLKQALPQVDRVITLGRDGHRIAAIEPRAHGVKTLEEAVDYARTIATSGSLVLLSPACASLDMFTDYKHRGEVFRKAVEVAYASR